MKIRYVNDPNNIILRALKDPKAKLWHIKDIFDKSYGVQKHRYINKKKHGDTKSNI